MKKYEKNYFTFFHIFSYVVFCFLAISISFVHADAATRVSIHSIDPASHTLVITFPKEEQKWLLHYKNGCSGLTQDSVSVTLVVQGNLNANQDLLKVGEYDQCEVNQAEEINAEFTVDSTFPSGTESILTTEKGARFSVQHPQSCGAMRNFLHQKIYADLSGEAIEKGDRLYLPANAGTCVVGFSQRIKDTPRAAKEKPQPTPEPVAAYTQPGVISDLKATPVNGAVELSWRIAREVENVDYYWVSYSRSPLKTKDYTLENMPDKQKATTNFYKVTGLENDDQYYFYVISIDKNGHPASDWSNAAAATPTASAFRTQEIPQGNRHLNFRVKEETDEKIVFEWDLIPRATRYMVALEMNGKRDWILQGVRKTVYVNKTPMRKGKDLRLVVRGYNRYGMLDEAYYTFKF